MLKSQRNSNCKEFCEKGEMGNFEQFPILYKEGSIKVKDRKKQKYKKLITIFTLAFAIITTMLFGNVNIVNAEETENNVYSFSASVTYNMCDENGNITTTVTKKEYEIEYIGELNFITAHWSNAITHLESVYMIKSDKDFIFRNLTDGLEYTGILQGNNYTRFMTAFLVADSSIIGISLNAPNEKGFSSYDEYDVYKDEFISTELVSEFELTDFENATYSADIPTPSISLSDAYNLDFNNASDNYYFEVKGRWRSIDDIELYKKNFAWRFNYASVIKSDLTEWVTAESKTLCNSSDFNIGVLGKSSFEQFLFDYPVESRTYTGGTNALGNVLSGYESALANLQRNMALITSGVNRPEFYIRYFTIENGQVKYGRWCHCYANLLTNGASVADADFLEIDFEYAQSNDGLTNSEFDTVENLTDSTNDIDIGVSVDSNGSAVLGNINFDTEIVFEQLQALYTQVSSFLGLFSEMFSFLPEWLRTLICCSIGTVCVVGVWKCVKG